MIDIMVLNWNGFQHLNTCLSALCAQKYQDTYITMVDNGSVDSSVDYVRQEFPNIKVIALTQNVGFCEGNNVGIKNSNGEYVALINNDTEADIAWLSESVKALEENPDAGFTASRMRLFNQRTHLDTAGDLYFSTGYPGKRGWLMPDGPEYDQRRWVWGACAGAAVYRRTMLEEIGLFDEDFFAYMEDTDLNFRAQLMGYKCIYVPSAVVYHKVGATAGRQSKQRLFWSHRNHWYTLIKNLPLSLWLQYLPQILAAELLVMGSAIQNKRIKTFSAARRDVIGFLPKMLSKRRLIQQQRRVTIEYIDSLIRKDWVKYRTVTKKLETQFSNGPDHQS